MPVSVSSNLGSFTRPGAEAQLARQVSGLRVNDMLVHEIVSSMVTDLKGRICCITMSHLTVPQAQLDEAVRDYI